ncbi:MAG: helix-turn-helix domain-containing protein [Planctomycetales bacterium]|nr:helix-turn-helix domain-containing protein [Planctomycetales bacterium]
MAEISQASEILKRQSGINPDTDSEMRQISEDYRVSQILHDARTQAGLTQQQLADAVGTTQSVISQLEDAEYDGHSLSMLRRIATALDQRLEIRMVARSEEGQVAE